MNSGVFDDLSPLQIALIYLAFGLGLLVLSDVLLPVVIADSALLKQVQAIKGGIEILLSGLLIYGLVRHSHRELRLKNRAMDEAEMGISLSDPSQDDNPLVYVNKGFERITGYAEAEATGRNCRFLQGEDTSEAAISEMAAAIDEERPVTIEIKNYRADGTPFWNEVTITPIKDIDGTTTHFIGFQQDITDRKEREQALQESDARFQALVDHFPDGGVFLFDDDLQYTIGGGEVLEQTGMTPDELKGKTPSDIFPDDLATTIETRNEAALDDDPQSFEVTWQDRDYHLQTVPLKNPDGDIISGMAVARDITEQNERTEELRQREQTYRNLVEEAPAPINLFDETGDTVWGNQALLDLLGLDTRDELIGESIFKFIHPDDHGIAEEELDRVVQEGGVAGPTSFRIQRTDGETRYIQVMTTSGWYEGERVGQAVINDVTELRETEAELRDNEQRYRTLVEMSPDPILVHSDGEIIFANSAFADQVGADGVEAVLGTTILDYLDASEHEDAKKMARRTQRGEQEPTSYQRTLRTLAGESREIATTSRAIPFDGQSAVLTIVKDRTEEYHYRRSLKTLHERTREMFRSEAITDAATIAVEAAADLQSVPGGVVYQLDEADNVLEPVADSNGLVDSEASPGTIAAETDPAGWEAFAKGETAYVTDRTEEPLQRQSPFSTHLYVPLGTKGMFVTGTVEGTDLSELSIELCSILGANLEAAIARVDREEQLQARDAQLEQQTTELEELDRLNTTIRDILVSLLDAATQEAVTTAVCQRLADQPAYSAAWIGTLGDELDEIQLETSAGSMEGLYEQLQETTRNDPLASLARVAIDRDRVMAVDNVMDDDEWAEARETALSYGFRSVVAVPISTDRAVERVLVVHGVDANTVSERECAVFEELGRMIGLTMDALGESDTQLASSTVTVDLEVPAQRLLLNRLSDRFDGPVTLVGAFPVEDGESLWFIETDVSAADATAAIENVSDVESIEQLAEDEERALYRCTVTTTPFIETIYEQDGQLAAMDAADGTTSASVRLPGTATVRDVVDTLAEDYPGTQLVARRQDADIDDTPVTFRDTYRQAVTDRQYQALQAAYYGGYYEWPRAASNEELAEALNIASPTYQSHRRAAERILVAQLFDDAD